MTCSFFVPEVKCRTSRELELIAMSSPQPALERLAMAANRFPHIVAHDNIEFVEKPLNRRFRDIEGNVVGYLKVIGYLGGKRWLCECVCGTHKSIAHYNLISQHTQSCGCKRPINRRRHGEGNKKSAVYRAYFKMIRRCYDENDRSYRDYGGRGIEVCNRWRFGESGKSGPHCFIDDMPVHPGDGYSLNRINNDGNYEPGNCEWADRKTQNANKRGIRLVDGKPLAVTARMHGINRATLSDRLDAGWSIERALSTPVRRRRK